MRRFCLGWRRFRFGWRRFRFGWCHFRLGWRRFRFRWFRRHWFDGAGFGGICEVGEVGRSCPFSSSPPQSPNRPCRLLRYFQKSHQQQNKTGLRSTGRVPILIWRWHLFPRVTLHLYDVAEWIFGIQVRAFVFLRFRYKKILDFGAVKAEKCTDWNYTLIYFWC